MDIIVIIVAVIIFISVLYFILRKTKLESLDYKLLSIRIPLNEEKDKQDLAKDLAVSEQLFASLIALGSHFTLECAVQNTGEEINFYVSVPEGKAEFVARQIQGLYQQCRVDEVTDYTIFSPGGTALGASMTLRDSYILPLRTYTEAGVDTFSQILSNLSKLNEIGEGASVQVVVRPAPTSAKKKILEAIESLKHGEKLSRILKSSFIMDTAKDLIKGESKKDEQKQIIVDDEAVKALNTKLAKPLFCVNIRVLTSGEDKMRAESLLLSVAGAYAGTTAPIRNELVINQPRNMKKLLYKYTFREFDLDTSIILNSEELSSLFHFPTGASALPRLNVLRAKESQPPVNLSDTGTVLGESIFRGQSRLVRMLPDDRRRHLYVIGQTGTGKSYLMLNMAIQDMEDGHGLCIIDPHGDLVDKVLERVPASRANDVIVFDPGDLSQPLGLNMLEYDFDKPEQKTFIVNEIQSIFDRLFDQATMGAMFQQYMRNTLLLLMGDMKNEVATLMEVPRVMTDPLFRARKLERCTDPAVVDFWTKEANKTSGETSMANMAPYITTKFGNFTTNEYMRPIIGQAKSAFNFRKVMDEKKILLVNLSKGKIGEINAKLLGMLITTKILMAALSRVDQEEANRNDFYFYIDEFQNFTTDSISTILSEARKYKLNLTLAHQFIAQLEDKIREAVFGNVGSMVAFRVGEPDTEKLEKQFAPEFSAKDLIGINNQNAVAKLLIKGEPSRPFNIKTMQTRRGSPELREKIRELSRLSFGLDRATIEADITRRLRD